MCAVSAQLRSYETQRRKRSKETENARTREIFISYTINRIVRATCPVLLIRTRDISAVIFPRGRSSLLFVPPSADKTNQPVCGETLETSVITSRVREIRHRVSSMIKFYFRFMAVWTRGVEILRPDSLSSNRLEQCAIVGCREVVIECYSKEKWFSDFNAAWRLKRGISKRELIEDENILNSNLVKRADKLKSCFAGDRGVINKAGSRSWNSFEKFLNIFFQTKSIFN